MGFSSTHESGMGGASKYGDLRVMPSTGPDQLPISEPMRDEVAWPGYYAVTIGEQDPSIRAELSASRLVGFHRYTFPPVKKANLTIEVSSVIVKWGGTPQRPLSCDLHADSHGGLNGSCKFSGGWNSAPCQLYFAAEFDRQPNSTGVSHGSDFWSLAKDVHTEREWEPIWALASFDTTTNSTVQMKLAVSFLSVKKAEANLREVQAWQWVSALGKIQVEGGSAAERNVFASSLFRAHVMPHDLAGKNV